MSGLGLLERSLTANMTLEAEGIRRRGPSSDGQRASTSASCWRIHSSRRSAMSLGSPVGSGRVGSPDQMPSSAPAGALVGFAMASGAL